MYINTCSFYILHWFTPVYICVRILERAYLSNCIMSRGERHEEVLWVKPSPICYFTIFNIQNATIKEVSRNMALIKCPECGQDASSQAEKCPHCGYPLRPIQYSTPVNPIYSQSPDVPSTGLNVLSFCFPLVGLILYCVKQGQYPRQASAIGKWAIIGFCTGLLLWFLLFLY